MTSIKTAIALLFLVSLAAQAVEVNELVKLIQRESTTATFYIAGWRDGFTGGTLGSSTIINEEDQKEFLSNLATCVLGLSVTELLHEFEAGVADGRIKMDDTTITAFNAVAMSMCPSPLSPREKDND